MNKIDKYINKKFKSFCEVRYLLEADNIKPICFKDTHKIDSHNQILIDFLKIDKKNNVSNLKNIFYNKKTSYSYYTTFPLEKIYDKQRFDKDNDAYRKIEIIMSYLKEVKYCSEMMKPLNILTSQTRNNQYIHLNNEYNKMSLTTYKYIEDNRYELEIIEPNNKLKNPLYGILNYFNLDYSLFYNKSIALQRLKQVEIDKEDIKKIKNFFETIQLKNYKYKLNIEDPSFNKNYQINLYFYYKNNNDYILSFKEFDREFLLNIFSNIYNLKSLLEYTKFNKILLNYGDNIEIKVKDKKFKLKKDYQLCSSFLKGLSSHEDLSIYNKIKKKYFI